jgi:hypothetical protein
VEQTFRRALSSRSVEEALYGDLSQTWNPVGSLTRHVAVSRKRAIGRRLVASSLRPYQKCYLMALEFLEGRMWKVLQAAVIGLAMITEATATQKPPR